MVIQAIKTSKIGQNVAVMTPVLTITGIAGNYAKNASQTFLGIGQVYSDQLKMQIWDGFGIDMPAPKMPLDATSVNGYIGKGLALNLSLCEKLNIKGCVAEKEEVNENPIDADISSFLEKEKVSNIAKISLLVAASTGAPNIANLELEEVWEKTQKNLDDMFIALTLEKAQILLYGESNNKASSINIQLKSYYMLKPTVSALRSLFVNKGLNLEVIDLETFNPEINKVLGIFGVIFGFVSAIIGLIVVFTISNTMTMSVMERFNEIGTLRSMGLRRSMIRRYFVLEGSIIGVVGSSLGVVLAYISILLINAVGIMWSPPNTATQSQLTLSMDSVALVIFVWGFLIIVSIISSLLPAIKASKMAIVDALRHN